MEKVMLPKYALSTDQDTIDLLILLDTAIKNKKEIVVDFSEVDVIIFAFIATFYTNLYSVYDKDTINKYVHLENMSDHVKSKVDLSVQNVLEKIKEDRNTYTYKDIDTLLKSIK